MSSVVDIVDVMVLDVVREGSLERVKIFNPALYIKTFHLKSDERWPTLFLMLPKIT